jgi:hypothetical protein
MGSQQFKTYSRGKSANEAYNKAVEDANDEYGHQQGYSGEINSSAGFRDVTSSFKASKKSLDQYMNERLDFLTKFQGAEAICIEEPVTNNNKIKSQVEHVVEKGTKKWVLKYYAQSDYKGLIGKFAKKGDAVKAARKYTEETGNSTYVEMRKDLEKGSTITARIKYKKSTNEKDGRWIFYGWASC